MTTGKGFKLAEKSKDTASIEPNYLYIRFDPKNGKQEKRLREHRKIVFIDYPFEYENGERYHRENPMEEGERLSYYTSIPIGSRFPKKVPHTILQELYIPEKDPKYDKKTKSGGKATKSGEVNDEIDLMNHVIQEAYASTSNQGLLPEPPLAENSCKTCVLGVNLRSKWNPSGNVQIFDGNSGTTTRTIRTNCRTVQVPDYSTCGSGGPCPTYRSEQRCDTRTETTPGEYVPIEGANIPGHVDA